MSIEHVMMAGTLSFYRLLTNRVPRTLLKYIGEMETRLMKETEMVFGNFEGKDVRSGSFTVEPF